MDEETKNGAYGSPRFKVGDMVEIINSITQFDGRLAIITNSHGCSVSNYNNIYTVLFQNTLKQQYFYEVNLKKVEL